MATSFIKVLLVEDDEDDYVLIRDLLSEIKNTEYVIEWVRSYDEALKKMASPETWVCLMDYRLGPHDGLEILQDTNRESTRPPIIFVTGWEDYETDLKAMKSGATDYLVKSQLNGPLLDRSIRYAMERWQSEQELRKAYEEMEIRVMQRTAELAAANAALEKSSEEIKLFAYSVAHDLKNPVLATHGLVKRLSKNCRDLLDDKGKEYCRRILASSEHTAILIEQIYTYISARECRPTIEMVSLEGVLQSIREEFGSQLKRRNIYWSQPDEDHEIPADRLSLTRILRNLVENALKYGGDGLRRIQVGYRDDTDHHVITVQDDGAGIQVPDTRKIFGLFNRSTNAGGVQGLGLGLTIVKELAKQHNGDVWVEPAEERGAAFFVSLAKSPPENDHHQSRK
jgi:signal transduction histidine kinase